MANLCECGGVIRSQYRRNKEPKYYCGKCRRNHFKRIRPMYVPGLKIYRSVMGIGAIMRDTGVVNWDSSVT